MDCAIDTCFAYELAFLARDKLAIALLYLGRCSTTKSIRLLGSYYFDGNRRVALGFVIRQFGVSYSFLTFHALWDYMYCDGRTVKIVDLEQH